MAERCGRIRPQPRTEESPCRITCPQHPRRPAPWASSPAGHASGVRVRDDGGVADVHGRAVILGCGGFEANVQMRTQHIGPLVGGAKVRGTPHNQGDGLRMAMAIGAMPWGQWSGCHATPISADWGNFAPRELTDRSNRLSYLYGVMINCRGHRSSTKGRMAPCSPTPSTAALSLPN